MCLYFLKGSSGFIKIGRSSNFDKRLYFFAGEIFNMNLMYKPPAGKGVDGQALGRLIMELIGSSLPKNITITQEKTPETEGKSKS
jgi:hypothetical protein